MSISPEILRRIYALGLSKKQLCEIMMIISELPMQSVTAGAIRMRRHRSVTSCVTECVTPSVTQPPPKVFPLSPPKSYIKPPLTPIPNPPQILCSSSSPDSAFVLFWKAFPRREAKQSAARKFKSATQAGVEPSKIIAAAERYALFCRQAQTEKQFIKLPDTWLNKGCWDDELPLQQFSNGHVVGCPKWEQKADGWWRDGVPVNKDGTTRGASE